MGDEVIHARTPMTQEQRAARQAYDRARYQRMRAERLATRPPDPITLLDEPAVAYLAGLTDGDGSIYVTHTNRLRTYYPAVVWAMTNHATIAWVAECLGAKVTLQNRAGRERKGWESTKFRDYWRTSVAGSRAKLLCERMLPYVHAKSEQARIVLTFPVDERRAPGHRLSDEVRAERERLAAVITALNR